jgi:hypothetical protein
MGFVIVSWIITSSVFSAKKYSGTFNPIFLPVPELRVY